MKLRTSKVLKFLAILLFSLESLAPTLFYNSVPRELVKYSSFERTYTTQSLFLSTYAEECNTEERMDASGRQIMLLADVLTTESLTSFTERAPMNSFFRTQQGRSASAPPLFKLHCTYLI
jgi:hypothetical protein